MVLSHRKRLILVKSEATYGVDPVPAAADAVLCSGLELRPLEGEYRSRDLITGQLGMQPEALVNRHARVNFTVEAGGGSAAGTPPSWRDAILACGFAETVTAGTDVVYALTSDVYGSAAVVTHVGGADGHRQLMLGCRGTVAFEARARELPRLEFGLIGQFAAPAKAAPPAADYTGHVRPLTAEPPNVPVLTIGGTTLCAVSLRIEGGHQVSVNRYLNCPEVSMGDRAYTGRVQVRMPALDAKDLIAEAQSASLQALAIQVGTVAGNRVRIDAPACQLKFEGYTDNEGDLDVTLGLNFTADEGDDEIQITVS